MKKNIISGIPAVIFGLLIVLGPQYIFRACSACCVAPVCLWSVQTTLGLGMSIAAMGICIIVINNPKTSLGLHMGILLSGLMVLLVPLVIIGGCEDITMACHTTAFPALTIISSLTMVYSTILTVQEFAGKQFCIFSHGGG